MQGKGVLTNWYWYVASGATKIQEHHHHVYLHASRGGPETLLQQLWLWVWRKRTFKVQWSWNVESYLDRIEIVTRPVRSIGILFNGKRIACKHLVADSRLFPRGCAWKTVTDEWSIARKICLLEDSVMPAEKEQLTFVSLPPKGNRKFVVEA